ncbi:MAG: response regulator, partial [Alphaproteobacteria bacterium]|nr:response regulator [Alphaproteobacteria bacterium]
MTEPIHVLLVEDNPGDARLVREMLSEGDSGGRFRIEDAATMATALEALGEREFQVVLLDLSLPDSQGLDTVAQIRRARPTLPIVVLTGLADEEMAVRAVQGGAQDYLVKGQGEGWVIRRAIRHALERLRFEHALRSNEAELRVIFEGAATGIALAGRDGTLLKINPALQWMLGSPDPERCGIHDFAAACACGDNQACETELRVVRPDFETRWVKVTVSPAHGGAQDPVRVVMV